MKKGQYEFYYGLFLKNTHLIKIREQRGNKETKKNKKCRTLKC